jgi:hypothetical protein
LVLETSVQLLNITNSDGTARRGLEHVVAGELEIDAVFVAV